MHTFRSSCNNIPDLQLETGKHKVLSLFLGTEVLGNVNDVSVGASVLKPKTSSYITAQK